MRVARPKRFPPATYWRGQQRLRRRIQNLALCKVYQQKPLIVSFREIPKHEACWAEHRAVDSTAALQPKPRIFPTQLQKLGMQIIKLAILFALEKIKFAPRKSLGIIWCT